MKLLGAKIKAALCLAVITSLMLFAGCGSNSATPDEATADSSAAMAVPVFDVNTVYGKVHFPERWKDKAEIKTDDKKIAVEMKTSQSGSQPVFDICFGESKGNLVGRMNNGSTDVRVVTYEPEKDAKLTEQEKTDYYVIMEDLNYILESLNKDCGMEFVLTNMKAAQ